MAALKQKIYTYSKMKMMNPPKYGYPYPSQGTYHGPPVMAPPYAAATPPAKRPGFLEACLGALCCCCLMDACCDPFFIAF
ncbi:hypothetical protein Leryth_004095 [Lithospermum erythrorhizon]|nr:hypothetical protein Leryth_004095 [Lithospermum erythrorhizon]